MRLYWRDSLPMWLIRHFRHHSQLGSRTSLSLQYMTFLQTDKKTIQWDRSVKCKFITIMFTDTITLYEFISKNPLKSAKHTVSLIKNMCIIQNNN